MTLAVLAEQAAGRLGEADLVTFGGATTSTPALLERATRVATGLAGRGVRAGDRVLVCSTNSPEVLLAYQAIWRAGGIVTPVLPALTVSELRHVLTDSGALLALVSAGTAPQVRAAATGLAVQVVVIGEPAWAELEAGPPGAIAARTDGDLAALLYTGGTTGRAKGVALTHGGLAVTGLSRQGVLERSGVTSLLIPLPLSHVYGLLNAVCRFHARSPGHLVLQGKFDAAGWVALVAEHRLDGGAVVPSMLALLLSQPLEQADLGSLRYVTCGGAPLAPALVVEFERRVPTARVCDGYGCTEVTSTATMNPYDAPRPGTVGLPIPGVSLQVVDDTGAVLATGQDGEVCVRGPGVMLGYWQDPVATAEAVVDGWLRTGDIGHLDQDGYLVVVDRRKDLVIRSGFNVYPRDVEDALLLHPAVVAAAVVGRPDPLVGEEVVAFVALSTPVQAGELLAWAAQRLGSHKRPREVHVVDAVPLTSVGKTDRKAVRLLLAGLS